MNLRPFQLDAVQNLRNEIKLRRRSILLVSPTGSGKTVIAAHMIEQAVRKGKRIYFLAHRVELIEQCSAKLDALEIDHGVIMANHSRRRPWLDVQVASVPTLARRMKDETDIAKKTGRRVQEEISRSLELSEKHHARTSGGVPSGPTYAHVQQRPDLIFIDEAHRARSRSYQKILAANPQAVAIGLTATPVRADGLGLGELFQSMVACPSVAELTRMGFLVPSRVYAPAKPDVSKVETDRKTGDYATAGLAHVMDTRPLVGDIVGHWMKLGRVENGKESEATERETAQEESTTIHDGQANGQRAGGRGDSSNVRDVRIGDITRSSKASTGDAQNLASPVRGHGRFRPTVCFAVSVDHSRHIADQFQKAGIGAEHIDATTPPDTRRRILDGLSDSSVQVVCNVEVLTEGWDCPAVSHIIMARPTQSLGLHLQMCGRVLRPSDGKSDAVIQDHAGNVHRHGFVDDEREWTLTYDRDYLRDRRNDSPGVKTCPWCFRAMRSQEILCPGCGRGPEVRECVVPHIDGELREETGGRPKECIRCGCRYGHGWQCGACGGEMLPVPRKMRIG